MNKWHKYKDEKPKKEGQYLCCTEDYFSVYRWENNLYKFDKFDFFNYKGKKVGGFVEYDSEWGYTEQDPEYWQEIIW